MTIYTFEFQNYYIRSITEKDISKKYLGWLKNKEVNEYLEIKYNNYNIKKLKLYAKSFNNNKSKYLFGVYFKKNKEHIGNTTIYNIDYNTGTFDIGYLIGQKNHWGTSASTEVILLSLQFAFDFLKLRKIFTGVYSNHIKSRFTLKKVGFVQEACLKDKFLYKKKPVDEVIYTVDRENWLKIKKKYNI